MLKVAIVVKLLELQGDLSELVKDFKEIEMIVRLLTFWFLIKKSIKDYEIPRTWVGLSPQTLKSERLFGGRVSLCLHHPYALL